MSKRGVEAAVRVGFSSPAICRSCRSNAAGGVEVHVEAVSKPTNFDTWTLVILGGLDLLGWILRSGHGPRWGGFRWSGRAPNLTLPLESQRDCSLGSRGMASERQRRLYAP